MSYYSEELLKLGRKQIFSQEEQNLINEEYKINKKLLEESLQWQNSKLQQLKTK